MIKLLGAVLIVMAGVFSGVYLVQKEERRVKNLKELECFAIGLISALKYSYIPIDDYIFSESQKEAPWEFVEVCAEINRENTDFHVGWNKAARVCFESTDVDFVKEFGEKLGTSDLEGQINYLEYYVDEIKKRIASAWKKRVRAEKTLLPFFGCLGIGLAILMV